MTPYTAVWKPPVGERAVHTPDCGLRRTSPIPCPKDRARHCMYSLSQWNCVLSYSCVNMYMKSIVLSIKVHQLFDKRDTDLFIFPYPYICVRTNQITKLTKLNV